MYAGLQVKVDMKILKLSFLLGIGIGALGCASSPGSPAGTGLNGNWVLAGALPAARAVPSLNFGLTATLGVSGSEISGVLYGVLDCNNALLEVSDDLAGTIHADGSFTLNATSSGKFITGSVSGHVPSNSSESWSGNYELTVPSGFTCSSPLAGSIAAQSMPLINGAFVGSTADLSRVNGPTVTLTATVQQSGPSAPTQMQGTLTLQGSTCLTSGVSDGSTASGNYVAQGFVDGNSLSQLFRMNDGSVVEMTGIVGAVDSSKLEVSFLTLEPGSCNSGFETRPVALLRQ